MPRKKDQNEEAVILDDNLVTDKKINEKDKTTEEDPLANAIVLDEVVVEDTRIETDKPEVDNIKVEADKPKYEFAGGTNPNYALDVDDDIFYNQFISDYEREDGAPFMGNFWTNDGRLTQNHVETHDNMLQLDNGKIVSKNTWDRFNKIAWRKNAMPLVDPVEISPPPPPEILTETISGLKNNNQSTYEEEFTKDEIKGNNLNVDDFYQVKLGSLNTGIYKRKDIRNSKEIEAERDSVFKKLIEKDPFIKNEWVNTVISSNQENIDNKLEEIQNKYDLSTQSGVDAAETEYVNYLDGLIVEAQTTDKNLLERIKYYEDLVNEQYGNRIRNLQQKEGAEEILGDSWYSGGGFWTNFWKLFNVDIPQSWFGTSAARSGQFIDNYNKQLRELGYDPATGTYDEGLSGDDLSRRRMLRAPSVGGYKLNEWDTEHAVKIEKGKDVEKSGTGPFDYSKVQYGYFKRSDDVQRILDLKKKEIGFALKALGNSEEYKDLSHKLGHPRLFDDDFNLDSDWSDIKGMYGTQAGQMILGMITFGGSTFLQETSGVFLESLEIKGKAKSGLSDQEWAKLPRNKKAEWYLKIIDAGEGDMDTAMTVGGINALIDTASNLFVIGGIAKGLPKNSLRLFIRGQIRESLSNIATQSVVQGGILPSLLSEVVTEVLQEVSSNIGVASSTGQSIADELWNKESKLGYLEAATQAGLSTFGFSVGGKVIVSGGREISAQIASQLDPEHVRNLSKQAIATVNEEFEKGNLTEEQRNTELNKIDLAEKFVNNTKFKNIKDPKARETVFLRVAEMEGNNLQMQEELQNIEQLKEIAPYSAGGQRDTKVAEANIETLKEKNAKLHDQNLSELYIQNYKNSGKTFAEFINSSNDPNTFWYGKTVTTFKTLDEARAYFKNTVRSEGAGDYYGADGKLDPDLQAFLDGNDNGINFKNADVFTIDERIKANTKAGDKTSANVIHHEILHFMLQQMTVTDMKKWRKQILSDLSNSQDSQLAQIALKIKELKGYKDFRTREGNEEFFAALSDVFMMAEVNDISLEATTTLGKIGEAIADMFTTKTSPGLFGTLEALKDGTTALDFIKTFNKTTKMPSVFTPDQVPIFKKKPQQVTKLSKSMQEDINNTLVETIKNPETSERDKGLAIQSLIANNPIIYKALGFNVAKGTVTQAEIDSAITAELLGAEGGKGIINTFDPTTSKFSTYLQNIFSKRKQKIYEMAGLPMEGYQISLQSEQAREVVDTADTTGKDIDKKDTPKKDKVTKKVFSKEFDFDSYDKIIAEAMLGKDFVMPTDYKSAVDFDPRLVAELFGVDPDQYIDPKKSLRKQDMINARAFIKKYPELIYGLLPKNLTSEGKATGIRNILLKAFYTKADTKEDAKFGKSKQGSFTQTKKPFNLKEFLAAFGMGADQKMMKVGNQTQQSGIVSAVMNEVGKVLTNQAIRKNLSDIKSQREQAQKLRDGASRVVWSRSLVGTQGLDNLVREAGFIPLDPVKDKAEFRKFMTTDFVKFFPGSVILADNFGPNEERKGRFFFDKDERGNVLIEAGKNETHGLTPNDIKALKVAWGSKGNTWFNQDLTKGTYKTKAELSARGMELMIRQFRAMLDPKQGGNPANIKYISAIFAGQGQATKHMIRQIALPTGKSTLTGAKINEHVIPANWMANFILDTIHKTLDPKTVDARINWIKDNYYQLRILKTDDNKVTEAGFAEVLPDDFMTKLDEAIESGDFSNVPSPLIRYVDPKVNAIRNGIDLNKVTFKNQTLAEYWNVDIKGRYINNTTKGIQQRLAYEIETGEITRQQAREYMDNYLKIADDINKTIKVNAKTFNKILTPTMSMEKQLEALRNFDEALRVARDPKAPEKGISVFDFDDTVAVSKSRVKYTLPDGTTDFLTPTEFAEQHGSLEKQKAKFDYSEFNKVIDGKPGPLAEKLRKQIEKFGNKDVFILSARPQASAKAIHEFLKGIGLNIPVENITGLEDGTPQAKGNWMIGKAAEGYNNFLFADDVYNNVKVVQDVLDIVDVKREVQQAKASKFLKMGKEFDKIIAENTGMDVNASVSLAKAKARGANKGSLLKNFFLAPSAEDFAGLLYTMLGSGKKGEKQWAFLKESLLDPFARGIRDLNAAKQRIANEYAALKKKFPEVTKSLSKDAVNGYTNSQAMRVYLWNKNGIPIPGLTKTDEAALVKHIKNNPDMMVFADQIGAIPNLKEGYTTPSNEWMAGNLSTDMLDVTNKIKRDQYLKDYNDNYEAIFTPERMQKLEYHYGTKWVTALKDMRRRMKEGTNKSAGVDNITRKWQQWVNNSVGAIMFFNVRSAVLQTLSSVNFINWGDNNAYNAAKAFANQKQWWKDFSTIFNSDTLKQRRTGMDIDINWSEIAAAANDSKDPVSAALNWLLQKGFTPTRIADSFAIASGGASFYRNRINTYMKEGMDQKAAEEQAWIDFQEISEATQQSARPDMISQQQAGPLGRLVLAFQVTPMQYTRLMKRAVQDLVAGRGDTKTHISKIMYYGAVQNIIFNALQSALFALAFDDEKEDEEDKMTDKQKRKVTRVANNMLDTLLRGLGVQGAAIATVKNMVIKFLEQDARGYQADHAYTVIEGLNISPPIGSKARKVYSATQTWKFNKDAIKEMGFDINNPAYDAVGNVVSGFTNAPLDRVISNLNNIRAAMDKNNEAWQRLATLMGWNTWNVNIPYRAVDKVKADIKKRKAEEKKRKREEEKRKKKKK